MGATLVCDLGSWFYFGMRSHLIGGVLIWPLLAVIYLEIIPLLMLNYATNEWTAARVS